MAEQSPGSQARRTILGLAASALLAMSLAGCQLCRCASSPTAAASSGVIVQPMSSWQRT